MQSKPSGRPQLYILFLIAIFILPSLFFVPSAWGKRIRDTLHFHKSVAEKNNLELSDSMLNEIGLDSLLTKIEDIHNKLSTINNATATGFDTRELAAQLTEVDSNIGIIDENITDNSMILDVKNLQMFAILLKDLQSQLTDLRTTLADYHKELSAMNTEVGIIQKDTILESLMADSAFRSLYINEIEDLDKKMTIAKKEVTSHFSEVNQLQSALSSQYFETMDLHNRIKDLLKKTNIKAKGKEFDYLWEMHAVSDSVTMREEQKIEKSYRGQLRVLKYYFQRHQNDQWWMLLTGILFGLWIFRNYRKIEKSRLHEHHLRTFLIIQKSSILPTMVVLFNLSPFFDIHPPTAYVDMMQFLLVVSLTILLWRIWPKKLFIYWLVIIVLFLVISVIGAIIVPSPGFRITLFIINILSSVFGFFWFRKVRKNSFMFADMIRIVAIIYIGLNILAACCNLFGRLSLAKIMSVTAIHGVTQVVGLSVFIHIVTEAFQLQTMVNRLKGGLSAKLNFEKIQNVVGSALKIIAICIWCIVFSISLNMYNLIFKNVTIFLTTERKIGNTTFELGSILLFIGIIYISNMIQKGIGSLYGNDETWDPEVKKNGSRLAMTRLVLILSGFIVAVAASGLPIDKITIVLGALGVGIGLGLQTIVNNLVSGVILIFEQPFRIGDYIQVGDQKGRVLDIGIRSSKLVMEEGAEIILPNADLLSGKVINWTLRNDHVRLELPVQVEAENSYEEIKDMITSSMLANANVVKNLPVEILMTSMKEKNINMIIHVWIENVHKQQAIKSELVYDLTKALAAKNVKMV